MADYTHQILECLETNQIAEEQLFYEVNNSEKSQLQLQKKKNWKTKQNKGFLRLFWVAQPSRVSSEHKCRGTFSTRLSKGERERQLDRERQKNREVTDIMTEDRVEKTDLEVQPILDTSLRRSAV